MDFWSRFDGMLASRRLVIDRPRGSAHPRFPARIYPLDYGYLEGTSAADGGGIDVWRGNLAGAGLCAVVCTVDTLKNDAEIKLLLDCSPADCDLVTAFHGQGGQMSCLLVPRPGCPG